MHLNDKESPTPHQLLDGVYETLRYNEGALFDAVNLPDMHSKNEWIDKGDWLRLASEIGAEKVFFVNNDPVIVFCTQESTDDQKLLDLFRRCWCMARPQCLFLALPGELRIYSLNQEPVRDQSDWQSIKPIDVIYRLADVAERLQAYSREKVETGQLFQEKRFGDIRRRADKRLIQDLKFVRHALLETGLEPRHAHALIGRSIFIRYLEDREILTFDYFAAVAGKNPDWNQELVDDSSRQVYSPTGRERWYHRVLQDKAFTYAFFQHLAQDFNGDMFPRDKEEENMVDQAHLDVLRRFLLGDVHPQQPALFLWAYDFEIVPTDLISSIYEEFYHANNNDDKGTHYTPSVLVEYVLHQVLHDTVLEKKPRILDPACGSGIFLVEAFRRIVRYHVQKLERNLSSKELRTILQDQISGIELNPEAIRVTAFSLYLALLHYQEPPDIRRNPRLPHLIYHTGENRHEDNFGILFNYDTFNLTENELEKLRHKVEDNPNRKRQAELQSLIDTSEILPIAEHSFDLVIGNPPWGASKGSSQNLQSAWCDAFDWPNGFKEHSQAFIARVLVLMKEGGECGFLIPTGILFHQKKSEAFRNRWLEQSTIKTLVNFAHVRHVFFNADAAFAFVHFLAQAPTKSHKIYYWSAKRTELVDRLEVITLNRADLRQVLQTELHQYPYLWKTYWWGNHQDAALIKTLSLYPTLDEFLEQQGLGSIYCGFKGTIKSDKPRPGLWLSQYKELPADAFRRFGSIDPNNLLPPPATVSRRGAQEIYEGWRILVKRTQNEQNITNGIIVARLESMTYAFKRDIYGFSVDEADEWLRKVLVGILWSSLARYFLFLVSGGWGIYHYEILLEELKTLPIALPTEESLRTRIVKIVDQLMAWSYSDFSTAKLNPELASLQKQLDQAIFELYKLSEAQQELVEDMCGIGLELLYRDTSIRAMSPISSASSNLQGTVADLKLRLDQQPSIQDYLRAFLQVWNRELEPNAEFAWHFVRPENIPMIAVIFTTQDKGQRPQNTANDLTDWNLILKRCAEALRQKELSQIYIDGMVRAVSDTHIFIIKRDERRLWTRSMAREDAEATRLQAMYLEENSLSQG
jgi:hypothetical protein